MLIRHDGNTEERKTISSEEKLNMLWEVTSMWGLVFPW
jgi:hypothetical protein